MFTQVHSNQPLKGRKFFISCVTSSHVKMQIISALAIPLATITADEICESTHLVHITLENTNKTASVELYCDK